MKDIRVLAVMLDLCIGLMVFEIESMLIVDHLALLFFDT